MNLNQDISSQAKRALACPTPVLPLQSLLLQNIILTQALKVQSGSDTIDKPAPLSPNSPALHQVAINPDGTTGTLQTQTLISPKTTRLNLSKAAASPIDYLLQASNFSQRLSSLATEVDASENLGGRQMATIPRLPKVIEPNRGSRRKSNKAFCQRADVVKKTVLRAFKKKLLQDFDQEAAKVTSVKRVNMGQKEILRISQKIVVAQFGEYESTFPDLALYLSALLQPKVGNKKHFSVLEPRMKQLTSLVSEALYNFSKGKLLNFLAEPQFALILYQFLFLPFSVSSIKTQLDSSEAQHVYEGQIGKMKEMCEDSLKSYPHTIKMSSRNELTIPSKQDEDSSSISGATSAQSPSLKALGKSDVLLGTSL